MRLLLFIGVPLTLVIVAALIVYYVLSANFLI